MLCLERLSIVSIYLSLSILPLFLYFHRNPFLYSDVIYNLTADSKEYKARCDLVHEFSSNIIQARKKSLVSNMRIQYLLHMFLVHHEMLESLILAQVFISSLFCVCKQGRLWGDCIYACLSDTSLLAYVGCQSIF